MTLRNELTDEEKFITYLAELSNLLLINEDEEKRIDRKDLQCFVAFVLAFNRFGSIVSQTAKTWLLEYLGGDKEFTEHSLNRYRKKLVTKEWLIEDGQVYTLPPIFDYKLVPKHTGRVFNFTVNLRKPDAVGSGTA